MNTRTKAMGNNKNNREIDEQIKVDKKSMALDGLPIRELLPEELKEQLNTRKTWFQKGRLVLEGASGHIMHAGKNSRKTFCYYLLKDTVNLKEAEYPKICATCKFGTRNNYCVKRKIKVNNRIPFVRDKDMCYKCGLWQKGNRINQNWVFFDENNIEQYYIEKENQ